MKKIFTILAVIVISVMLTTVSFAVELPSKWALSEVTEAINFGFVPEEIQKEYSENITRAEFAKVAVFYLAAAQNLSVDDFINIYREKSESLTGKLFEIGAPFTDTNDYYVNIAFALGIINGRGNGIFDPDSPITRQEAAVMLLNAYCLFGMYTAQEKAASFRQTFTDYDNVAEWAYESVTIIYQFGVMNGVSDNIFSPLGYYTREQCMATFLRLYKNSPSRSVLLPYDEARERIIGVTLPKYHLYNEFDCDKYSVYYGGQTGTSHGENYSLWIVYRSGGRREILHTGEGLPSNSPYRNDVVIYDLVINEDESTLTFKRDFNDVTYNYSVELMTAKITEIH